MATEDSALQVLPLGRVKAALQADQDLARAWASHLAHEVQHSRAIAEILSLKRVAEKVDAWMAIQGGEFPAKGHWMHLASEIGVTPEALYRELRKRTFPGKKNPRVVK